MSHQKRFFCFTVLMFSICILLYGLNIKSTKLTALAGQTETEQKSFTNSFEFIEDYEYKIMEVNGLSNNELMKMQKEDTYSSYDIDSYKTIDSNKLDMDCMEAIDMRRLFDGDSAISIDFKGRYSGDLQKETEVSDSDNEVLEGFVKIGEISFNAVNKEPYFRISNLNTSIGIGTKDFVIPRKVYELTPIEISDFNVYCNIKHVNNNDIDGSIIIKRQNMRGSLLEEIALEDLDLSEEQVSSIKEGNLGYSTLEIVKNFVCTIPLGAIIKEDEFIFEYRNEGYDAVIEVELPLRFQAKVIHN